MTEPLISFLAKAAPTIVQWFLTWAQATRFILQRATIQEVNDGRLEQPPPLLIQTYANIIDVFFTTVFFSISLFVTAFLTLDEAVRFITTFGGFLYPLAFLVWLLLAKAEQRQLRHRLTQLHVPTSILNRMPLFYSSVHVIVGVALAYYTTYLLTGT